MGDFLYGIAVCGAGGASLFFLKYLGETRDRLFLFFAGAFAALAVDWVLLAVYHPEGEYRHLFYICRLLAFGLILAGIWDKNRTR